MSSYFVSSYPFGRIGVQKESINFWRMYYEKCKESKYFADDCYTLFGENNSLPSKCIANVEIRNFMEKSPSISAFSIRNFEPEIDCQLYWNRAFDNFNEFLNNNKFENIMNILRRIAHISCDYYEHDTKWQFVLSKIHYGVLTLDIPTTHVINICDYPAMKCLIVQTCLPPANVFDLPSFEELIIDVDISEDLIRTHFANYDIDIKRVGYDIFTVSLKN